jgi:diguanylate cyclase (GGDEF)-like protein
VFHSSLLGVLVLAGTAPFLLTDDDRGVLDAFVTQAGVAIRNARLYDDVRVSEERLAQRSRELDLLNRMGEMLQACVTEDEAYTVVGRFVSQFFPDDPGAVFVMSASRNMVEARTVWAATPSPDWSIFKPEECWALRRGRMHVVESTAAGLLCSHLPQPAPASYLCIPLIAQGESLGILYLGARAQAWTESQQRLASTVADQLGLAVANLKLRETLRNQSIRDPLTGLFNRRYLEETLERELSRAERNRGALGVVMVDLDRFKQFNDTYGHDAGDMLLRELGRLLQTSVRGGDVACRYGGEEFVLILPGADAQTTRQRADRLRESVKQLFVSHHGQSVGSVTMSAGVAAFPDHGTTGEALMQAADAALYRAKSDGRDRVVVSL